MQLSGGHVQEESGFYQKSPADWDRIQNGFFNPLVVSDDWVIRQ